MYKRTTSKSEDGTVIEQLKRFDEKDFAWKLVVHEENVFDALHECHQNVGHKQESCSKKE